MSVLRSLLIFTTCIISTNTFSRDFNLGIGSGIGDGIRMYFPIRSGGLTIEPSIRTQLNVTTNDNSSFKQETENDTKEYGIGIFGNREIYNKTNFYYGLRTGYIKKVEKINADTAVKYYETSGYFVAPTIGIEFNIVANVSIGVDLGYNYARKKGSSKISYQSSYYAREDVYSTDILESDYNTESEIVLRYMF